MIVNQSSENKGTMLRRNGLYGKFDQRTGTTANQNLDVIGLSCYDLLGICSSSNQKEGL